MRSLRLGATAEWREQALGITAGYRCTGRVKRYLGQIYPELFGMPLPERQFAGQHRAAFTNNVPAQMKKKSHASS